MAGKSWFLLALIVILSGCSSGGYVPVADRTSPSGNSSIRTKSLPVKAGYTPSHYTVRKGDTLYAIAWRYNLDFKTLARLNNIGRGYNIYPGQRLALKASAKFKPSTAKTANKRSKPTLVSQKATKSTPNKVSKSSNVIASRSNNTSHSQQISNTSSPKKSAKVGTVSWSWPSNGKVIKKFTTKGTVNKGVNIAGRKGDAVFAAASGQVVYAGNGILGYGNLIIINHNGLYMSAYAHNSQVFVRENERVRRGDKIAEIGRSGTDRYMLHFEIRRDGKPVNPSRYLPKRRN